MDFDLPKLLPRGVKMEQDRTLYYSHPLSRDSVEFGPQKDRFREGRRTKLGPPHLLGGGVLRDGLGALRYGMLGQFPRQEEPDGSLNFPRCNSGSLIVMRQTGCFRGDSFKDVIDKAVHDGHCLAGDACVRVNLFEDLVNVDSIALLPLLAFLLVPFGYIFLGLPRLLRCLASGFRSHRNVYNTILSLRAFPSD